MPEPERNLDPTLEARIAALERPGTTADFDRSSWVWMVLLGIVLPAALILIGWWA